MEVHFSPDVEMRLQQVASANGKDAKQLVKDTVTRMLENQARFIGGVQRGIEQADLREFGNLPWPWPTRRSEGNPRTRHLVLRGCVPFRRGNCRNSPRLARSASLALKSK